MEDGSTASAEAVSSAAADVDAAAAVSVEAVEAASDAALPAVDAAVFDAELPQPASRDAETAAATPRLRNCFFITFLLLPACRWRS